MDDGKLDRAIDAFLSVYGDMEGLDRQTFHAILAEKLEEGIGDAISEVYCRQVIEHRRTLHTVWTRTDYLIAEVAERTADAAVDLLLNSEADVTAHLMRNTSNAAEGTAVVQPGDRLAISRFLVSPDSGAVSQG